MLQIKDRINKLNRFPPGVDSRLNFLRLDKNEGLLDWDKDTLSKIFRSLKAEELSMYPEPERLYKKLAAYLGISQKNILLTNGSDGGIKSAFEVFINPGDRVIVLNPTYAMYDVYIQMFGAKKIGIPFRKDFMLDSNLLFNSISSKVKLIAIANPNSPTGTVIEQDFLLKVTQKAESCGCPILIDEAYFHFYPQTMLKHIKKYKNLIILRTFSKAWGAASIRLGYVIADQRLIHALFKVRPMYETHTFALKVAESLVDHPNRLQRCIKTEKEGKKYLADGLEKLGFAIFRGYANFVLVNAAGEREKIAAYFKKKGILVYLPSAHSFLRDYFRVTTGPKEKMRIVLGALEGIKK